MNRILITISLVLVALSAHGEKMSILEHPRYGDNPVYLFFEAYIQDVIGSLPKGKSASIQNMNIQNVFKTEAREWRLVVKETLHLSETIDIAILDLWYKNREQFKGDDGQYDPVWFSQIFTDKYMEENSKVDVWPDGSLDAAKKRIKEIQSKK